MRLRDTLPLVPLAAHRVIQRTRAAFDERGGLARFERRERRRFRNELAGAPSLSVWLARPEAGRFWIEPNAAPRWARRFCSAEDLAWAEAVLAGTWSPLGGEFFPVGSPPAWRRDRYSGAEWPADRASRIPLLRGDGSDIRTVWELSRCHHLVPLAKAFWRTGERRFLDGFVRQVGSWLDANPPVRGPNWRSPMDAAIRAANWVLAAQLFGPVDGISGTFWCDLLANLRVTALLVERRLEWHPVYRGNHYLSNAVGLVYVGALFRDDPLGGRWLRRGAAMLEQEMAFQVGPDGVSVEAAIGYHRLVAEFFTFAAAVCERNGHPLSPSFKERLRAMYRFMATYEDAGGRAPLLGDADDGRLHLLCAAAAARPRAHRLGLPRRLWPNGLASSAAFPQGGFYILRSARSRCIVRCGKVGLRGAGSHDHNDQLSYELVVDGRELIADSGTFVYTRDLRERFAFRATAAHNAVQLGGEEQNPIRVERPWRILRDRTRSQCIEWSEDAAGARFVGQHSGFAHRPSGAVCQRLITARFAADAWSIQDRVKGRGREQLTWRTHFAPGQLTAEAVASREWALSHSAVPDYLIRLTASTDVLLRVGESRRSERYGEYYTRPVLELRGDTTLPVTLMLAITRRE